MARAQFEYDEAGNTFFYVLLAFYFIVLLPLTYYLWPGAKKKDRKKDDSSCRCSGCEEKAKRREQDKPWEKTKTTLRILIVLVAWVGFFAIAHKVSQIEVTHQEYDPYAVLGLDQGAEAGAVRKAYRELSKVHHPDRGGDPVLFDKIAKAYQALTDEEVRKNWELYGSPDGQQATTFGIALPKWLVSKEYGVWVLAFYGLIIMVALPVAVGFWWYNSIKYNVDKVLLDTTQLFSYFIYKTPRLEINRALLVLGGAFEFWRQYNKDIVERESDDVELPRLIRELKNLTENNKERPLCLPYSLKARILIHSHLTRLPVGSQVLAEDQRYILSRSLRLIEEMVGIATQFVFWPPQGFKGMPIETVDNLLRLFPMLVQAQWNKNPPLLQLPHLQEGHLYHLRKQRILTCSDLARLEPEKRRQSLPALSEAQYRDVLVVLASMPKLTIETVFEVIGEEDAHEVTAGCLVTLKVKLTRHSLLSDEQIEEADRAASAQGDGSDVELLDKDEKEEGAKEGNPNKRKPWEKPPKKQAKKKNKAPEKKKAPATPQAAVPSTPEGGAAKEENKEKAKEEEAETEASTNDSDNSDNEDDTAPAPASGADGHDDSDLEDWSGSPAAKKAIAFDPASRNTHLVHAPFFPLEKYEWWWVVLSFVDRKERQRRVVCPITACKTLVDQETVELRFTAPAQKGVYLFNLQVKSDSYMDCDYSKDVKLEVGAPKAAPVVRYADTDDEEEEEQNKDACCSSDEEYTEDDADDSD